VLPFSNTMEAILMSLSLYYWMKSIKMDEKEE